MMFRFRRGALLAAAQMLAISAVASATPVVITSSSGAAAGVAATPASAEAFESATVTVAGAAPANAPATSMSLQSPQLATLSTLSTGVPAAPAADPRTQRINSVAAAQRVLVWFKPGASSTQRSQLRSASGVARIQVSSLVQGVEYWDMKAPSLRSRSQARSLVDSTLLQSVEPDVTRQVTVTPDDPMYSSLWGLESIGAPTAWQRSTGSKSVVVAVLDTGMRLDHVDLQSNLWTNPGEIPGNNIDDDNNGYVDDVHGWNFIGNNNLPMDDMFHGTHVSGIIGAAGNNATGVVGVNWNVSIMPLKVCNTNGGCNLMEAMEALEYAVRMGARISNNSYGGDYEASRIEQAVIAAAGAAGHVFVAAAGNSGTDNDLQPTYPASYPQPNIISVEAIDESGDMAAPFSNYGNTTVDIAAPGVRIRSTDNATTSEYAYHSGTSMATPYVAGAAALLAALWQSRGETWTVAQLKQRLMNTVRYPAVALHNVSGGTLDLAAATDLQQAAHAPVYVHLTGSGAGTVHSASGDCAARDCRLLPGKPDGETLTLVATPAAGTAFIGWTGACSTVSETCTVTLRGLGASVTARFGRTLATTHVRTFVESETALPAAADMRYQAFVRTVVSGDGATRATARFFNDVADDGYCYFETSTTGGITIERKVGGVWVQDGAPLASPGSLDTTTASARWFNCFWFGDAMTLSRDGSVLAVNLGASLDVDRTDQAMCGVAVYRRGVDGTWSTPDVLHPDPYSSCWTPWRGDTLTGVADWRAIAMNDSGTSIAVAGIRNLRVFNVDTATGWTLTTIPLPIDVPACRLDLPSSVAFARNGGTIAFAWPACNIIGTDPYGRPNADLDQYARGRVLIYEGGGTNWALTADLSTTDSSTVGTMGLGHNLAISADGTTLVAGFERTWATVIDKTDYIGGAMVFERRNGTWTFVRRIDNPSPDGTRANYVSGFACPVVSADASRIVCGQPSTAGLNEAQGWFLVLQRSGATWTDTPTATTLALNDGNPFDQARITSADANADAVYASFGQWRLDDHLFGDNPVGILVTPTQVESTTATPLLTNLTVTADGFAATVANADAQFEYRVHLISTTSNTTPTVAYDSATATVSVSGMLPASEVSIAVGTWLNGVQLDERGATVRAALLPANTPVLTAAVRVAPVDSATAFTTTIANMETGTDVRYAAVVQSTTSSTLPIITWPWQAGETITVTNLSPGSVTTLAVVLVQDLHEDSVATVTAAMPTRAALTPVLETVTAGAKGFTAHIANMDPAFRWTALVETTTSTVLLPSATVDTATATLRVSGVDPSESATVRVTVTRPGYETGTGVATGRALPITIAPILETATATSDGFTIIIGNFDDTHTWSAVGSLQGSSATIETATSVVDTVTTVTALAHVRGVAPGTASTVTVYAALDGYESGTATSPAVRSINGAALVPVFDTPTATPHGFTVRITNSDTHFAYLPLVVHDTATVSSRVVAGVVEVEVAGLASSESATVIVRTTRAGYDTGTASTTGTALPPYRITFVTGSSSSIPEQWHARGDAVAWPADPALTGFTFTGWRNSGGAVDTSTFTVQASDTMTAQWSALTHIDTVTVGSAAVVTISDSATVSVLVETSTAGDTLTVSVRSVTTPSQLAAGLIAVSITVHDETGTAVTSFSTPLRIDLGHADTGTGTVAWSTDGTHWQAVPHLVGTTLADGQGDGWYTDTATAHVVVLTRHLTAFGSVRLQSPISASSWWSTRQPGQQTQIEVTGGGSSAPLTFTSTATGVCTVDASGLVTAVAAGTCTITVERAGDSVFMNTVAATVTITVSAPPPPPPPPPVYYPPVIVLLPALAPAFELAQPAVGGFTMQISNFDARYTWTAEVSAAGAAVAVDASGVVTVTGMQPDTEATVTVRTARTGYLPGSATTPAVRSLRLPARTPQLGEASATYDRLTVAILNFDPAFAWSATLDGSSSTPDPAVTLDAAGVITVAPMLPGTSARISVTTSRAGYDTGTATAFGSTMLLPALVPAFESATSKADGFTIRIANFDPAYQWSVSTSQGEVRMDGALITVFGLAPSGFARVTVATSRSGFTRGEATAPAVTALPGAALLPQLDTVSATADGFTARITNFSSDYLWSVSVQATDAVSTPTVTVDANGVVTVTGVAPGAVALVRVDTARPGYDAGSTELRASAMPKPEPKPSVTVTGTALKRPVVVALGTPYASKPVTVQIRLSGTVSWKALFTATLGAKGGVTRTVTVPHRAAVRVVVSGRVIVSTTAK